MNLFHYIFQDSNSQKFNFYRILKVFISNRAGNIIPLFRYCSNIEHKTFFKKKILFYRYYRLCEKYNVFFPIGTRVGSGLKFPHNFPVVINPQSVLGKNVIIHPCVLIGRDRGKPGAPIIGDNVFIGHGAKIIGNPIIGSDVFISPGAIITKNISEGSLVGAGVNHIINREGKKHVAMYI